MRNRKRSYKLKDDDGKYKYMYVHIQGKGKEELKGFLGVVQWCGVNEEMKIFFLKIKNEYP